VVTGVATAIAAAEAAVATATAAEAAVVATVATGEATGATVAEAAVATGAIAAEAAVATATVEATVRAARAAREGEVLGVLGAPEVLAVPAVLEVVPACGPVGIGGGGPLAVLAASVHSSSSSLASPTTGARIGTKGRIGARRRPPRRPLLAGTKTR
jgi:hypothetical protein